MKKKYYLLHQITLCKARKLSKDELTQNLLELHQIVFQINGIGFKKSGIHWNQVLTLKNHIMTYFKDFN